MSIYDRCIFINEERIQLKKFKQDKTYKFSATFVRYGHIKNNNNKSKAIKKNSFQIITSDGRLIKVDKNGRFHLLVDNFINYYDQEILTLKLLIEDNDKLKINSDKTKFIKVKPSQLIRSDFNIYLGGKNNE